MSTDAERFPWTGRPFGLKDLRFVSAVRRPHVASFAGMANAGKTTLLAMVFLLIYRGHRIMDAAEFAGSFTLQGWENIARHLQLDCNGPIQFPPHTSESGRFPGLLHLRFSIQNRTREVLFSDAPGEWFSQWTDDPSSEGAAGARWIASNADKIAIVADTAALTGPQMGPARTELEFLIRRTQGAFSTSAVALVWSKTDISRPKELVEAVNNHFHSCFPGSPIFSVRVPATHEEDIDGLVDDLKKLFQWAVTPLDQKVLLELPKMHLADPFLAFRGQA